MKPFLAGALVGFTVTGAYMARIAARVLRSGTH